MRSPCNPIISAIVAMGENRVIGAKNQLPWHLPADLAHFKTITTGHPILMGRKTYESIGKPLPNRTNIILTRDPNYQVDGCLVVSSVDEAIAQTPADTEIFIIGGAEIYQQFLSHIQRLYLTIVHQEFDGDVFFPKMNMDEWKEISREAHTADERNVYAYSFLILEKIR